MESAFSAMLATSTLDSASVGWVLVLYFASLDAAGLTSWGHWLEALTEAYVSLRKPVPH